ncbi:MAG: M15 family peptidase [Spirochaetales bacterium]|nr:MAG: M15 family peptidase [Spirochaetales bacterium]
MKKLFAVMMIPIIGIALTTCSTPKLIRGLPLLKRVDFTRVQPGNGTAAPDGSLNADYASDTGTSQGLQNFSNLQNLKSAESRTVDSFPGKNILSAIMKAYPDKVKDLAFRNGDWAIDINGTWFCWARGRVLPENLRDDWEKYTPYPFYSYADTLPPIRELSDEEKQELDNRVKEREENPPSRHPGLYNALWGVSDRSSSWEKVKTTYFFGLKTEIHRELLEDLAAVEEEILTGMKTDDKLRRFVESLVKIDGYNFRNISGTDALSFHSYGTALDILPAGFNGKQVYWLWAKPNFPEWYSLPYEKRFMPPEAFIRAFENHGFVWGGKWFYFDTIHFEYRPEIFILNGMRG